MLLDTHVALWLIADSRRLGTGARQLLATASSPAFVSVASAWEMSIKVELGKLDAPDDLVSRVESAGLTWLALGPDDAWQAREVSGLPHRDPFDRLLIAQAAARGVPLMTADAVLLAAEVQPIVTMIDARV